MTCAECGQDIPDTSQYCAACAAAVSQRRSTPAEPLPGGLNDAATTIRARKTSRLALVIFGVAVAALVTIIASVIVAVALVTSSATSSSGRQLAWDQLRPGECLTGSNLPLGTNKSWPDLVTAVPCKDQHLAEVFFARNMWSRSLAFSGVRTMANQAVPRCDAAFMAYDGVSSSYSMFTYTWIYPSRSAWTSGSRLLVCVAYMPGTPNGAPVDFSIRRSYQ